MTTPAGVPNLPIGALTVDTLAERLQDMSPTAMRNRAGERMPEAFEIGSGGSMLSDFTPMGVLTNLWAGFNSTVATADPADIQGPEDLPGLLVDFLETIPVVGILVRFMEALGGDAESVEYFLKPIFGFFQWLWNGVSGGFDGFAGAVESILKPLFEFLNWLVSGLWDGDPPPSTGNAAIDGLLNPIFSWLAFFWGLFGDAVEAVLTPIAEFVRWAWDTLNEVTGGTADEILRAIIGGVEWVWVNIGEPVVKALGRVVEWIASAIDLDTLKGFLADIVDFFSGILNPAEWVSLLKKGWIFFQGFFGSVAEVVEDITDLVVQIPLIGPLIGALTGRTPADGEALDLSTLGAWARDIDDRIGTLGQQLWKLGEQALGQIPVGQINQLDINLLAQGDFLTASTINAASGWSWDSSVRSGTTGGSAKATCTGSEQILYSTQSIRVTPGDRITLTAKIRTSGFSSGTMKLALIPWVGTSRYGAEPTKVVATRTTLSSSFNGFNGTAWTIPAGVTSVQAALIVQCNSGASVWFDDLRLSKTGLMGQGLVTSLLGAWGGVIDGLYGFVTGTTTITGNAGRSDLFDASSSLQGAAAATEGKIVDTNATLFGDPEGGTTVVADALPLAEIFPTAGSGAMLVRSASNPMNVTAGRGHAPDGFFTNLSVASDDILCLLSNGDPQTGAQSDYAGAFKVTMAGWYMVELAYRMTVGFGDGAMTLTPVLYKGSSLGSTSVYKVGTEVQFLWLGTTAVKQRFAQSSFIVYLNANNVVRAGMDVTHFGLPDTQPKVGGETGSGTSGTETYFSISLLNKSYA